MRKKKKQYCKHKSILWLCLAALLLSACSARPQLTVTGMGEYQTETQDWQEQDPQKQKTQGLNQETQEQQLWENDFLQQQSQLEDDGTSLKEGTNRTADSAGMYQSGAAEAAGIHRNEMIDAEGAYQNGTADAVSDAIVVYVCGAVVSPGVYQLPPSSRVYEAVAAAGGFLPDADEEWYNQAKKLQDGEMIKIYTRDETAALMEQGESRPEDQEPDGQTKQDGSQSGGQINLNTANMEQLMSLPGIGEAKAEAILAYRQEHGQFQAIEEIMQISGIKEAVFAKIKDRITV